MHGYFNIDTARRFYEAFGLAAPDPSEGAFFNFSNTALSTPLKDRVPIKKPLSSKEHELARVKRVVEMSERNYQNEPTEENEDRFYRAQALLSYAEERYTGLIANLNDVLQYSENFDSFDFVRCQRPSGKVYGTRFKCKPPAVEIGAKEDRPKPKPEAKGAKSSSKKKVREPDPEETPDNGWERTQKKHEKRQREAMGSMDIVDVNAIRDYAGGKTGEGGRSYRDLNACLRKRTPCLSKVHRTHARELDAALKKLPANTDGDVFYRGMAVEGKAAERLYDSLSKMKPGTKIKDPGFSSYTSSKEWAGVFQVSTETTKSILFVSRNKELRPMNLLSRQKMEYEAILPRGASSTVRGVTREGDTLIVELD